MGKDRDIPGSHDQASHLGLEGKGLFQPQGLRRVGSSGALRAAVLGVNDGLVSNFSLVMGVSGGTDNPQIVLLAGVAGLLAGAFSMATGEYVSMRAQRDVYERALEIEARELEEEPEEEKEELALIYQAKGFSPEDAQDLAELMMANPQIALETHAREELGLTPSQLGSPWGAAFSSFGSFIMGALIPILPYLVGVGDPAVMLSIILSAGSLATVGALLAALSGKRMWWGGLRMLLAGSLAATVTFGIGTLVAVTLVN